MKTLASYPKWRLQMALKAALGCSDFTEIFPLSKEELVRDLSELGVTPESLDTKVVEVPVGQDTSALRQEILELMAARDAELKKDVLTALAAVKRPPEKVIVLREGNDTHRVELEQQHYQFETLLRLLSINQNVFLVGPAGSGKSTAAKNAAKALNLDFYFNGAINDEYKLLGFTDAQGRIVSRPFRNAFLNGGLYFFDEVDASMPDAVLAFNAALANRWCDFPDGCFEAHPNFRVVAAGNTYYGADHLFTGRQKQDGAFLDRFAVITWGYDKALETAMARAAHPDTRTADLWHEAICRVREQAAANGIQIIVSPRATVGGLKAMAAGFSWEQSVEVFIRKGMKPQDWERIKSACEKPEPKAEPEVVPTITLQSLVDDVLDATSRNLSDFFAGAKTLGITLNKNGQSMIRTILEEWNNYSTFDKRRKRSLTTHRILGTLNSPKCRAVDVTQFIK